MRWPKISVVIPSLNQGRFLGQAIESALAQKYPHLELLILDAGSTDESLQVIKQYESQLTFWTSQPDRGQSDAVNKGWTQSTGELLAWMNADDFYEPGALWKAATHFQENPGCQMLCGAMAIVDENANFLRVKRAPRLTLEHLLPWGSVPGQPSVFLRREVFEKLGGPRVHLHYVLDWELWLRIVLNYPPEAISLSPLTLSSAREWGSSKTCSAAGKDAAEARRVLEELFDSETLPREARALEKKALARTWWRQAESESQAGNKEAAWASFKKALRMSPFGFSASKILKRAWQIRVR